MKIPRDLKPGDMIVAELENERGRFAKAYPDDTATRHADRAAHLDRLLVEAETARDRALAELAAEREKHTVTTTALDQSAAASNRVIAKLEADLAAMTERAEKASGEVAEAKARAEHCYQCELIAEKEAEAAKQEAAGLRARKVKLPGAQREDGILPTITVRAEAWNACLGKCADAIRAAGIEVEG